MERPYNYDIHPHQLGCLQNPMSFTHSEYTFGPKCNTLLLMERRCDGTFLLRSAIVFGSNSGCIF